MTSKSSCWFDVYPAGAQISRKLGTYGYLIPVPIADRVAKFPNGFELVLLDQDQKQILSSDTLGTGKHLAALAACDTDS